MVLDILTLLVVFCLGFSFPELYTNQLSKKDRLSLRQLWILHLLVSLYFCFFVFGDAIGYWRASKNMSFQSFVLNLYEAKGTYFLYSLNYFPAKVLNLSYFAGTMLYSFLGFVGITYFYIVVVKTIPYNSKFKKIKLFPNLLFLPNLHFWSSGIGKDTLLFLAIAMFCYSMLNIKRNIVFLIFSLILSFLVRPHITLFLAVSFGLAYLFSQDVSAIKRAFLVLILIGLSIKILPVVLEYSKIEETSIDSFDKFSKKKASALSGVSSGSSIDISSYPFPLKVFSFLYRPFFFDIRSIPALIASVENLILLVLTIRVLKNEPLKTFNSSPTVIKGLLFFLIIGTLAFSQSLGNIGIMIRMRNMFLPGMLIFFLWSFSCVRSKSITSAP